MTAEPFATIAPVPDDALMVGGVELVVYVNRDGETCYRLRHGGPGGLAETLGLLEMAKTDLMAAVPWGEDE